VGCVVESGCPCESESDQRTQQETKGERLMAKRLTDAEKYAQLKRHTENAGMTVREVEGKIVVSRKKKT
jgi:hypothetical protein